MRLSVIVGTRNRAHGLIACFESIATSIVGAGCDEAELIVVDNGSTDDTTAVVTGWAQTAVITVRLIHEARPGLSAARNAGLRASRGDLIVFIDDDCRLSPTYVSELLRYDAEDQELIIRSGSVVLGDPTDLPLTVKLVHHRQRWRRPMDLESEGNILGKSLIGCNIAMRRAVFEAVGPFDELLGPGTKCVAAEDSDYFYRCYLAGIVLEVVPDLVVAHFHGRKDLAQRTKLMRNYAIGNGALAAKYVFRYPNFSRHLLWEIKGFISLSLFHSPRENTDLWIQPFDSLRFMLFGCLNFIKCTISQKITNLLFKNV